MWQFFLMRENFNVCKLPLQSSLVGSTMSTGFLKYIPVNSHLSITLQLDSKYGFLPKTFDD